MLHHCCISFLFRYEARTEHELPVLVRYIPKELLHSAGITVPDATVLDLIMYSREQIAEEYKSMGRQNTESLLPDAEWSIISVKPQAESFETPMQPITMSAFLAPAPLSLIFVCGFSRDAPSRMRNSLGMAEGGSGVSLSREKYAQSVAFWSVNVSIV